MARGLLRGLRTHETALMPLSYSLDLTSLRLRMRSGELTPLKLARDVLAAADAGDIHHAWISRVPDSAVLAQAARLASDPAAQALPLYGIPFAIKDNIDAAGLPTTAGCPAFSYPAGRSATVVQRLQDAGAMLIGKTNLDQFATGLVGTRSPYGACLNAFDGRYISGGSSSGSAVAVALNLVSFALGTDTAGSGRIPAGFNNIVGLKPTRGLLSARGVVPACRSLDCVSIFALTCADAWQVYLTTRGYDAADPYARLPDIPRRAPVGGYRCGVPRAAQLEFFGDTIAAQTYARALELIEDTDGTLVEIDYAPFREAAALLYQGPWVAERLAALRDFFATHPQDIHPVTRSIIGGGARYSALDAFEAQHRLRELERCAATAWERIDVLAVPTAPTIYTLEQVMNDPVALNTNLGYYTNFVNLFDLAAIAIPAGIREDALPAGITLIAPAHSEPLLCELGSRLHQSSGVALGATDYPLPDGRHDFIDPDAITDVAIAVVGAHLSGMPLNHQLTERGARLTGAARTAPVYRLYLLPGTAPLKPGLVRCASGAGRAIDVELWRMPVAQFGAFVAQIPAPLGIAMVELEDGRAVQGFVCESYAADVARDISEFGGWRAYIASQRP